MALSITVLGCSGTWASADSACSGYYVTDGTTRIWLDCGPGTMSAVQRYSPLEELDAVVITHEHPDHCLELPVLRNALVHGGLGRRDLPLFAPRGVFALLEKLIGSRGLTPAFQPKMITDRSVMRVGGLRLDFSRTDHPVETLAVRVDVAGRSFAFSADTGSGWTLETLSEPSSGIDLAFVESTFTTATFPGSMQHLTAAQAGATAAAAGVRHLVLTHLLPGEDPAAHRAEAATTFGGSLSVARTHERYEA